MGYLFFLSYIWFCWKISSNTNLPLHYCFQSLYISVQSRVHDQGCLEIPAKILVFWSMQQLPLLLLLIKRKQSMVKIDSWQRSDRSDRYEKLYSCEARVRVGRPSEDRALASAVPSYDTVHRIRQSCHLIKNLSEGFGWNIHLHMSAARMTLGWQVSWPVLSQQLIRNNNAEG